jgi:transposase-like protein
MSAFDHRVDPEVREVRRLEVITGALGRRRWSAEAKARIVAESLTPGVVIAVSIEEQGATATIVDPRDRAAKERPVIAAAGQVAQRGAGRGETEDPGADQPRGHGRLRSRVEKGACGRLVAS